MQIRRLRLVNFRQHADTTLELSPGLTGIVGANGAGKSTLLEAIAWAMYGNPAARGKRDSIRRRSAPARSRVEVELDIDIGVHRYRIVRSLQAAALYQDGEPAPIANAAAAVTSKITRLLGMTREEFFNTYFTGQKELAIMAAMSAPDRARFLSRVLGYERLAAVQTRLKDERTGVRASVQTLESGLPDPATLAEEETAADGRVTTAAATLAAAEAHQKAATAAAALLGPEWEAMERRRAEVQTIETDRNIARHAVVEAKTRFEALDLELRESLAAKARADELAPGLAEWPGLVERRNKLDADAQAFSGRRALEAQVAEVRKAVAAQTARLAELVDEPRLIAARAQLATLVEAVHAAAHALEEQRAEWVREKQDAETNRKTLLRQYADIEEEKVRLEKAGDSGICPTCGKPLGAEYATVLDDLEGRLAVVAADGRHYRARIDQLAKEPPAVSEGKQRLEAAEAAAKRETAAVTRLEEGLAERRRLEAAARESAARLESLEAQLAATPGGYDEQEHRRVRERLAELEPTREQLVRLQARAERAAELVPRATAAEQQLSGLESRVAGLEEKLSALGWSVEAYDDLRSRFQAAERESQAAAVALVKATAERDAALEHRRAVARRREERDRRAAELDRLRRDLLLNTELDRAFTDLRTDLNATIRPDLADAASTLLADLTAGRYTDMELDEDYVATIIDDGEPKPVISGGEEDVANLALRLAISQMIADRAGQPFSLLVLDEVFGSLDEERRGAVVDLLRGLADRFPQVILITHIESVRDGFDRIIRIEYDVEQGVASARDEGRTDDEAAHAAA